MIGRHLLTLRNVILLCVLLQNAGYVLIRKYSTITENVSSKEILLVAEVNQNGPHTQPIYNPQCKIIINHY